MPPACHYRTISLYEHLMPAPVVSTPSASVDAHGQGYDTGNAHAEPERAGLGAARDLAGGLTADRRHRANGGGVAGPLLLGLFERFIDQAHGRQRNLSPET